MFSDLGVELCFVCVCVSLFCVSVSVSVSVCLGPCVCVVCLCLCVGVLQAVKQGPKMFVFSAWNQRLAHV
jgi:hypothetical protein